MDATNLATMDETESANSPQEEQAEGLTDDQFVTILREINNEPAWRMNADIETDYYDNFQIDQDTKFILEQRGQPIIISNFIYSVLNRAEGHERLNRQSLIVRPDEDEDIDQADALNVKFSERWRQVQADMAISKAYDDARKIGVGWVEVSWDKDPLNPPYRVKYLHRRELYWDFRAKEQDLSDARYMIRRTWHDKDWLKQSWPQYADAIDGLTASSHPFGAATLLSSTTMNTGNERSHVYWNAYNAGQRKSVEQQEWWDLGNNRLALYEVWYKKWEMAKFLRFQNGFTVEFNQKNPQHIQALMNRLATPIQTSIQKPQLSWWIGPYKLEDGSTPYPHNKFPYIPVFANREDRTNVPYGLIRIMKSMQDEINARHIKMMHLLSVKRIIMDDDAHDDPAYLKEIASTSDPLIILNADRRNHDANAFRIESDLSLSEQQFQVLQQAKQDIQGVVNIFGEMGGQVAGNAQSGVAFNAAVDKGNTALSRLNENAHFAKHRAGELLLALVKHDLIGVPTTVKVKRGLSKPKMVMLNDPNDDGQGMSNDISMTALHLIIDDVSPSATDMREQFVALSEVMKSQQLPPKAAAVALSSLMMTSDLHNKEQIAYEISSAAGIMTDPDKMTDDEKQEFQQVQQANAEKEQMQKALAQADIDLKKAQIATEKAKAIGKNVEAVFAAMQAAKIVALQPSTAVVGQQLLNGAGWVDQDGPPLVSPSALSQSGQVAQETGATQDARRAQMAQQVNKEGVIGRENTSPMFPPRPQSAAVIPRKPQMSLPMAPPTGMQGVEAGQ